MSKGKGVKSGGEVEKERVSVSVSKSGIEKGRESVVTPSLQVRNTG